MIGVQGWQRLVVFASRDVMSAGSLTLEKSCFSIGNLISRMQNHHAIVDT